MNTNWKNGLKDSIGTDKIMDEHLAQSPSEQTLKVCLDILNGISDLGTTSVTRGGVKTELPTGELLNPARPFYENKLQSWANIFASPSPEKESFSMTMNNMIQNPFDRSNHERGSDLAKQISANGFAKHFTNYLPDYFKDLKFGTPEYMKAVPDAKIDGMAMMHPGIMTQGQLDRENYATEWGVQNILSKPEKTIANNMIDGTPSAANMFDYENNIRIDPTLSYDEAKRAESEKAVQEALYIYQHLANDETALRERYNISAEEAKQLQANTQLLFDVVKGIYLYQISQAFQTKPKEVPNLEEYYQKMKYLEDLGPFPIEYDHSLPLKIMNPLQPSINPSTAVDSAKVLVGSGLAVDAINENGYEEGEGAYRNNLSPEEISAATKKGLFSQAVKEALKQLPVDSASSWGALFFESFIDAMNFS